MCHLYWLERMVLSKTFEDNPLELEQEIQRIRALLDENDISEVFLHKRIGHKFFCFYHF